MNKIFERMLYQEDLRMLNTHVKRCLTPLVMRETNIRETNIKMIVEHTT